MLLILKAALLLVIEYFYTLIFVLLLSKGCQHFAQMFQNSCCFQTQQLSLQLETEKPKLKRLTHTSFAVRVGVDFADQEPVLVQQHSRRVCPLRH